MRAPAFWWRPHPSLVAHLLRPAAALYGAVAARRLRERGTTAPIPVICIGNFTVGGAGKTPAALAIAELLSSQGETPFFLTRGYGGMLAGPVRVDPAVHTASDVGDEPLLLARAFPTIVARERPAGAHLAARHGASLVIMDDGLQNPSLTKDLTFAVVDGGTGAGNMLCLPAGPLRAPLADQWLRTDAVIMVGEGAAGAAFAREADARGKPAFFARLKPERDSASRLRGQRLFAFAGIGRPEKFFETLRELGAKVVRTRSFPDHHGYGDDEVRRILAEAQADDLGVVTTEKDLARLSGLSGLGPLQTSIQVLPVRLVFEDETSVRELIREQVERRRGEG